MNSSRKNRTERRLLGWIPFVVYSYLVFKGAILPPEKIPHFLHRFNDKFLHGLEFFLLFFFAENAFKKSQIKFLVRRPLFSACGYSLLFGALTEWAQIPVPGRSCDFLDWLTDAAGALAALALRVWVKEEA